MVTPRISIGGDRRESLADLVARYRRLSEPAIVHNGLIFFTLNEDAKLYEMLMALQNHPKDTGLLKSKWAPPVRKVGGGISDLQKTPHFYKYIGSFNSGTYNVYILNEATIGEQQKLKYEKEGWGHFKKKKVRGSYKLKRYLKYVDKNTQFYTKQLKIVRQGLDSDWRKFVREYLYERFGVL